MPTLRERLDALEARVTELEGKDEKPVEDAWEKEHRAHIARKQEEARRDLVRRTKTGMMTTRDA